MKSAPTENSLTADEAFFARSLVIVEDELILGLNKPSGLASQGGRGGQRTLDDLLRAFARSNGKRPDLIHRLDKDTSGVILAAKTKPAASYLGKAMMGRKIKKIYLAVVAGVPSPREGLIDNPLRRDEQGREATMRVCAPDHGDAETALTRYRSLGLAGGLCLLELRPQTGRMHQLRAHLSHIGHPILGDPRYGGALTALGQAVPRLMLHARALEFPHPNGGRSRIEADPPKDFAALLAASGLTAATAGALASTTEAV